MSSDDIGIGTPASATPSFAWQVRGRRVDVAWDEDGDGPPVLLLPTLSPVSTRAELWPVARPLARRCRTVCVDWPGFGAAPRPRWSWRRGDPAAFLVDLCQHLFDGPVPVVAVGHAAGHVLRVAGERPATWSRIALVAPTWRGPLPAALGDHRALCALLRRLLELPLLGPLCHRLHVADVALAQRYRGGLFADARRVTPRLLAEKARVARQRHAHRATAAYVTGALDPVRSRAEFLDLVDRVLVPLLALCGTASPPGAWQEMLALSARPAVTFVRVPGALAPHEEHPAPVARALEDFLTAGR